MANLHGFAVAGYILWATSLLPSLWAFAHCVSGAAAYVEGAAICRRMPSLGVSSLDSGRSSERPPFFV